MSEQDSLVDPPSPTVPPPPQPNSTASSIIWPPPQSSRDVVINLLIECFSTPSAISNRYGTMSTDEASATARKIEDDAFSVANASSSSSVNIIQIFKIYAKEISKLVMETVKNRSCDDLADEEISSIESMFQILDL